jgi:peptidoglycan/LPS O-acetylase OafA/YrhL
MLRYRTDIDGLRAVAVVPVVMFHAGINGFGGGFVGVDVFFVVSGYLITSLIVQNLERGDFSILSFYERRARRILPALIAVVAVSSVFALLFFLPRELADFGASVAATAAFASNILFWQESGNYFDIHSDLKPLLHTWSLAVEEQFYIAFPLFLILCHRFFGRRWATCMLPILVASFVLSAWGAVYKPNSTFYLAPTRAWELLLGALLAVRAVPPITNRAVREVVGVAGLALITYSVVALSEDVPFPGVNALFPCLGAGLIIWAGEHGRTITQRILSAPLLVAVGLLSYSIYLWHWPALVFTKYIAMRNLTSLELTLLLLAVAAVSYLSWRYIETPIRSGARWSGRRIAATGAFAGAASLAFASVVLASRGFPARLEPSIQDFLAKSSEPVQRDCTNMEMGRPVCVGGAAGKQPSFVLVGDSHADALSPGVFDAAERLGLAGFQFTSGCFRPLPGAYQVGATRHDELTSRFVEFLRRETSIRLVIFAGYWSHQATGRSFRIDNNVLFRDGSYDGSGLEYNKVSFRRGLRKLLEMFPDRKFALIEDVPTGRNLDVSLAARKALIRGHSSLHKEFLRIPRRDYDAETASYRDILEYAAELPNGFVARLADVLCDFEFCNAFRNEALLYSDGDHLSKTGALLLADRLTLVLKKGLDLKPVHAEGESGRNALID